MSFVYLGDQLGIPIRYCGTAEQPLQWPKSVECADQQAITVDHLRPFMAFPDCDVSGYVYHEYRNLHWAGRRQSSPFVLSLMVLFSGLLDREWFKTAGHVLLKNGQHDGAQTIWVLRGQGQAILQAMRSEDRVADVQSISFAAGEAFDTPPGYGLVVMNTGNEVTILATLSHRTAQPDYEIMARHRGAAYWVGPRFVRVNPTYREVPPLRRIQPRLLKDTT